MMGLHSLWSHIFGVTMCQSVRLQQFWEHEITHSQHSRLVPNTDTDLHIYYLWLADRYPTQFSNIPVEQSELFLLEMC